MFEVGDWIEVLAIDEHKFCILVVGSTYREIIFCQRGSAELGEADRKKSTAMVHWHRRHFSLLANCRPSISLKKIIYDDRCRLYKKQG